MFVVTGGARGLGLVLAEALVEAGGHVYCLDRLPEPDAAFYEVRKRLMESGYDGSLHYKRVDVQDAKDLDWVISEAAAAHGRMDGLIAAAGVQNVQPALEYPPEKIGEVSQWRISDFLYRGCKQKIDRGHSEQVLISLDDEHQLHWCVSLCCRMCQADD